MVNVRTSTIGFVLASLACGILAPRASAQLLYVSGEDFGVIQLDPSSCAQSLITGANNKIKGEGVKFGPDGNLYVCDIRTNTVLKFDGNTGASLGTFVSDPQLNAPIGLAFGPDGNLYVANSLGNTVLQYNGANGALMGTFVQGGGNGLMNPGGLAFGPDGNMYVTSRGQHAVYRYDGKTGAPLPAPGLQAGQFVASGSGNLQSPEDVAFGTDGSLYVSDSQRTDIQHYDGQSGAYIGEFAFMGMLNVPVGLFFDGQSTLYVAIKSGSPGQLRAYDVSNGVQLQNCSITALNHATYIAQKSTNQPPVASSDTATTAEDSAVTINVLANDSDPDNDPLTVTSVTNGANGTVAINGDNTVTYTPNADFNGGDSFTYTIGDGHGHSASASVNVTITEVNDPPIARPDSFNVQANQSTGLPVSTILSNDSPGPANESGQTLTVIGIGQQPQHGTATFNTGSNQIVYTPFANYTGPDTFTYRVQDNGTTNGVSDPLASIGTININVAAVNNPPVANDDFYTLNYNTPLAVATPGVLANDTDVDGDPLTAILGATPAHGTLTFHPDGSFTYTPTAGYSGPDLFTYVASDGQSQSNIATVHLTINPPCAQDVTASVSINQSPIKLNKKTGFYEQSITVTNTSTATIQGPVSFMCAALTGGTLANATGTTTCAAPAGSPYINLNLSGMTVLKPGKSGKATLQFSAPGVGYTPRVLAGPNPR